MRRRVVLPLLLAAFATHATGASDATSTPGDDRPLRVFAAASLQGPLDTVAAQWTQRSGRPVSISYAASSALARQIDQGAPADVFIAADGDWMDWLAERDRIDAATRVDLFGNELVLVAPATGEAAPATDATPKELLPRALGETGRLAVADVYTVPAGRYARQSLIAIGRWDAVGDRLAMGDNVRAALAFVARGEAPLGVVYATDARAEPKVRVVARFPADTHAPIVYPAAAVIGGDAQAPVFVRYLHGRSATAVFGAAGFVPIPRGKAEGATQD